MSIEVKLPKLGEGVDSGDVLEVLVQAGDTIQKDQDIVELETDKATVGVPSSHAGKVLEVLVSPGDTVSVGAALITLEASASSGAAAPAPQAPAPSAPTPQAPSLPQPEAPTPTPPTTTAPPSAATFAPTPSPTSPTSGPTSGAMPPSGPPSASSPAETRGPIPAGPAIRRFAREVGVDLATVTGSGPGGRITREDVLEVVRKANLAAQTGGASGGAPGQPGLDLPGTASRDAWGVVSLEKTSKIRKTIAGKMIESWSTVPRVTNFDDADITELEKIRQKSKEDYAAAGIKLTSMPFLIKAVSTALRKHPLLNASLDLEHDQIIYKQYVNIGIAVDTDRGLVVPALRNTDDKSISEIARDLVQLAESARSNSFSLDDLRGGTFTISNLGAVGGSYSTPIINVPEVAILLAGRSRKLPMVVDDAVVPRLMMPLSLSYDHRLVDGATAARFLNEVIGFLQAPSRLLMAL